MPNSLFRQAGLKIGPIVLETLIKHYFDRILKDGAPNGTKLRSEELLYDEAFTIVKVSVECLCYRLRIMLMTKLDISRGRNQVSRT